MYGVTILTVRATAASGTSYIGGYEHSNEQRQTKWYDLLFHKPTKCTFIDTIFIVTNYP
jgi:hypothetical protein